MPCLQDDVIALYRLWEPGGFSLTCRGAVLALSFVPFVVPVSWGTRNDKLSSGHAATVVGAWGAEMVTWDTVRQARETLATEQGAIVKDWGGKLPIALVYPNSYYVGMSSLGLQTLYRLLNERPDVAAERVFWVQREAPYSVESQRSLADFSVVALSLSFELDLLHFAEMLRLAGLPVLASERGEHAPLVLAGGPVPTANPELLAPLIDAAFIGEADGNLDALADLLVDTATAPRSERRQALSTLPGLYVPDVSPSPVRRVLVDDLDAHPVHSTVLTPDTEFGDMYLVEISRGCPRGCRFCLAGYLYRPKRQRSVPTILAQAEEGLRYRRKIGLVGAAISDYSEIDELLDGLRGLDARIAVSSLRVHPLPGSLLQALADSGTQTITLAPEAGSDELRRRISKGVRREDVLSAAERVAEFGFSQIKLYFMVGLPGETDDDVLAITELAEEVRERFRRRVTVHVTPFVPKPHTPFERVAMAAERTLDRRIRLLTKALRPARIAVRAEGTSWARVQGVLARGDRAVGCALSDLPAPGLSGWRKMMRRSGLDEERYLGARGAEEPLPWDAVRDCATMAAGRLSPP